MSPQTAKYIDSELQRVRTLLFCPPMRTPVPWDPSVASSASAYDASAPPKGQTNLEARSAAEPGSLKAETLLTAKAGAPVLSSRAVNQLPLEIRLPHPCEPRALCSFLVAGDSLYEVNSFTRNVGATSVFLGEVDCILGSSPVLLATPIDPLFFFASLLHRYASARFHPLKQILQRSADHHDVQHNLERLALLPQVCARLHLISDVQKSQEKVSYSFPGHAANDTPSGSPVNDERDVRLHDSCRFSLVKTARFLEKITSRAKAAVLQQQQKQGPQHPLVFKECVLPGDPAIGFGSQQRPFVSSAEERPDSATKQEGKPFSAVAAAERLVDDYISGYLPKPLLEAVRQHLTRR